MAGLFGGLTGGPSAFTSPGLDPNTLAMLLRMQNAGGVNGTPAAMPGAAPQLPGVTPHNGVGPTPAPVLGAGPQPPQGGLMGGLGGMDLGSLMKMLGLGGGMKGLPVPNAAAGPVNFGGGGVVNAAAGGGGGGYPINNWLNSLFGGGGT